MDKQQAIDLLKSFDERLKKLEDRGETDDELKGEIEKLKEALKALGDGETKPKSFWDELWG